MDALTRSHILDNVEFDIAFASEEEAFVENLGLGDYASEHLLGVIDEVFDEVGSSGVYRFASLELDLGEMVYAGYKDEHPCDDCP